REQHRRPDGAVEARDVLADEMDVGGPPLPEPLLVAAVPDGRDVVQERIEPHPDGELRVERHADAPRLTVAGDVDVLQATLHEGQHLVATALRLNEIRVLLAEPEQAVLEARQRKEMARLAAPHRGRLVDRTLAVLQVLFRLERLAALAV